MGKEPRSRRQDEFARGSPHLAYPPAEINRETIDRQGGRPQGPEISFRVDAAARPVSVRLSLTPLRTLAASTGSSPLCSSTFGRRPKPEDTSPGESWAVQGRQGY